MTDRIIKIGFILTPLFWFYISMNTLNGGYLLPRQGQFVAMMCVAIAALGWMSNNKWIRAFSLYAVAWVVFANVYALCVPDPRFVVGATDARDFARHLMVALAIYVAITRVEVETETWFNFICIGAVVQSLVALPQYFGVYPDYQLIGWTGIQTEQRIALVIGTMENSNFFAAYLAISLPFFLRRNWFYFIPVILFHLAMSWTFTAWVAAVAGLWSFVGLRGWPVAAAAFLLFVYIKPHVFQNARWDDWYLALQNYHPNWFTVPFGHGPYAFWGKLQALHNDYLQYLFEFGAVGLSLILGYILTIYRGNRILFAGFVAAAVNMLGNFPTQLPPTAFLIIIILALIEKERRENDRIKHNP